MSWLSNYVTIQREFSRRTFGEGQRTLGITKHIEKELEEIRKDPQDIKEWIDVMILAFDGYWRAGGNPEILVELLEEKQIINAARKWPEPTSEDEPVEHDRSVG